MASNDIFEGLPSSATTTALVGGRFLFFCCDAMTRGSDAFDVPTALYCMSFVSHPKTEFPCVTHDGVDARNSVLVDQLLCTRRSSVQL